MNNEPWFKSSKDIEEFVENEVNKLIDKHWEERLDNVQYLLNTEYVNMIPFMKQGAMDDEFEQWLNNLT